MENQLRWEPKHNRTLTRYYFYVHICVFINLFSLFTYLKQTK